MIHRADVHNALFEGAMKTGQVEVFTSTHISRLEQGADSVTIYDQHGKAYQGQALIGADGVKSAVRQQLVGDPARVTGHVVYRAVVDNHEFPDELKWNAASIWVGPHCHLVHYPLRGGEQYNVVVTFQSRQPEEWGVTEGSKEEVQSYFEGIVPMARQLIDLPKSWKRWATADREPIGQWTFGRVTLLGDAAHPMRPFLAQGAGMALEDAAELGRCLGPVQDLHFGLPAALGRYAAHRWQRVAQVQARARRNGEVFHATGLQRLGRDIGLGLLGRRLMDVPWLYGYKGQDQV